MRELVLVATEKGSPGPSLTQYLCKQWLDKHNKNHLRTQQIQVRPYTRPERNR